MTRSRGPAGPRVRTPGKADLFARISRRRVASNARVAWVHFSVPRSGHKDPRRRGRDALDERRRRRDPSGQLAWSRGNCQKADKEWHRLKKIVLNEVLGCAIYYLYSVIDLAVDIYPLALFYVQ